MISFATGCSSASSSTNGNISSQQQQRQDNQQNSDRNSNSSKSSTSYKSSTSSSSTLKFNFNEAINSLQAVGKVLDEVSDNIKGSFDFSKNIPDMNKLFNISVNKTSCNSCSGNSNIFARKRKCSKCSLIFCGQCMVYNPVPPRKSICNRCTVFGQNPISKEALNSLKVRDLKWFLASQNISVHHCYEKSELVDLIISVRNGTYDSITTTATNLEENSNQQQCHRSVDVSRELSSSCLATATNSVSSSSTLSDQSLNDHSRQQQPANFSETPSHSSFYGSSDNQNDTTNNNTNNIATNLDDHSFASNNDTEKSDAVFSQKPVSKKSQQKSSSTITLDDIDDEDEIKTFSVKQLKLLLTRNFVNFKGCVERDELVAKVLLLYRDKKQNDALKDQIETEKSSTISSGVDENQCKICWEKVIDCVLLDCGHMLTCTECGKVLSECPICRQFISRVVHVFKS